MFIDVHSHAYRACPPFVVQFCTPDQLLRRYDELGIERGVILPIVSPEIYFPQSNEEVLDMVERHPDRFIPFCNVDPRTLTNSPDADFGPVLQYYKDLGCKGLGEVMPNLPVMHPLVQNLFKHAEAVGFPVIFDGSDQLTGDFGLYDDPGLPQLEHTLQKFPKLIILGHGPTFWNELGRLETPGQRSTVFGPDGFQASGFYPRGPIEEEGVAPKLMRRYPNLYGDLSDVHAWSRDPDFGAHFMEEFQDRLLFGTDICFFEHKIEHADILSAWRESGRISDTVFNKLARENVIKLLGLE